MFGLIKKFVSSPVDKSKKASREAYYLWSAYHDELEDEALKVIEIAEERHKDLLKNTKIKEISDVLQYDFPTIEVTNEERYNLIQNDLDVINSITTPESLSNLTYYRMRSRNSKEYYHIKVVSENFKSYDLFSIEKVFENHEELKRKKEEAISYLTKELAVIGSGLHGENRVNKELDMYDYFWTNLKNIRFEVDGESVESDNILVSRKGIFTIEAKNYAPKGNYNLLITKDGQWLKVFSNGKKEVINNVTSQMNRHIAYKQKVINTAWQKEYGKTSSIAFVKPIFVLANDTVQVENQTDLPIMRASSVYHYLMNMPDVLTDEQVDKIISIIKENNLPSKKYEYIDYAGTIVENAKKIEERANEYEKLKRYRASVSVAMTPILKRVNALPKYADIRDKYNP